MGLSIRAYARHRGVSHVAVKKAIDTGRISQETDGTLDPERADQEWQQNTASPRKPSPAPKIPATPKPARSVAQEPATESPTPKQHSMARARSWPTRLAGKIQPTPRSMPATPPIPRSKLP